MSAPRIGEAELKLAAETAVEAMGGFEKLHDTVRKSHATGRPLNEPAEAWLRSVGIDVDAFDASAAASATSAIDAVIRLGMLTHAPFQAVFGWAFQLGWTSALMYADVDQDLPDAMPEKMPEPDPTTRCATCGRRRGDHDGTDHDFRDSGYAY